MPAGLTIGQEANSAATVSAVPIPRFDTADLFGAASGIVHCGVLPFFDNLLIPRISFADILPV
jgi:hypothetical protein